MAVTPNYGWPVPVATDYVKDGWEAISDLGNAIDTTVAGLGSGLTLLNTTNVTSTVSQVAINNIFTADYDVYKIYFRLTQDPGNAQVATFLRLRVSGTDASGSNYENVSGAYENVNFRTGGVNSTQTGFQILSSFYNGNYVWGEITLQDPFAAARTYANWHSRGGEVGFNTTHTGTGQHNLSTSYTGVSFNLASITGGKIQVYGLAN